MSLSCISDLRAPPPIAEIGPTRCTSCKGPIRPSQARMGPHPFYPTSCHTHIPHWHYFYYLFPSIFITYVRPALHCVTCYYNFKSVCFLHSFLYLFYFLFPCVFLHSFFFVFIYTFKIILFVRSYSTHGNILKCLLRVRKRKYNTIQSQFLIFLLIFFSYIFLYSTLNIGFCHEKTGWCWGN